jgi:hypothetical protein
MHEGDLLLAKSPFIISGDLDLAYTDLDYADNLQYNHSNQNE